MAFELFPYQKEGVKFLAARDTALLADEPGVGKTLQAIYAAKEVKAKRVLVVCPLSVRRTWCKVIKEHNPVAVVTELKSTTRKYTPIGREWVVLNYDNAKKFKPILSEARFDVAILDESHRVKNIKAAVTTAVLSQTAGITKKCDRIWAMTGTPVLNRPVELYPIMHHLFPCSIADCRGWYDFTMRFCGGRNGNWGWEANGATHLDDLSRRLKPHMLRRMLSDVQSQLPTATINPVYIEPSEVKRATLAREREIYGGNESIADRAERLSVGEIVSIRRQVGMDKVAFAEGYLRDILENGDKTLVFTYHRDVAKALNQCFLKESVLYTGEQTIKQKSDALDAFINGGTQLFIAQIKAAGTGTDGLQKVCHRAVFVEQSYVPGEMDQAIGRLVRIGQTNPVCVDILVHEDSIDEDIMKSLEKKREVRGQLIQRTEGANTPATTTTEMTTGTNRLKELNDQLAKLGVL